MTIRLCVLVAVVSLSAFVPQASADEAEPQLVFRDRFDNGSDHWEPTDAKAWRVEQSEDGAIYRLHAASKYKPPHRSPLNIALLRDVTLGSFTLEAKVRSTSREYNHRDMCLFFGYQDPAHFYYVHFGKKTDDHANQIFIVDGADRKKISTETTPGTPWTNDWHSVKLVRNVEDGTIEVYFDDMEQPAMRAVDKTFVKGRIGLGSFDDTGDFDDVRIYGKLLEP